MGEDALVTPAFAEASARQDAQGKIKISNLKFEISN